VCTLYTRYYVEVKMPNLIYAFLIRYLAIVGYYNTLVGREVALFILVSKVILPS